jgi:uncharacterized protein (DUF1330 family)
MAKGYWIGRVDVRSDEGYKPYAAANTAIFKKFGGRFVIRAGKFECPEGAARSRNVVIEFPDYASALELDIRPELFWLAPQARASSSSPIRSS